MHRIEHVEKSLPAIVLSNAADNDSVGTGGATIVYLVIGLDGKLKERCLAMGEVELFVIVVRMGYLSIPSSRQHCNYIRLRTAYRESSSDWQAAEP